MKPPAPTSPPSQTSSATTHASAVAGCGPDPASAAAACPRAFAASWPTPAVRRQSHGQAGHRLGRRIQAEHRRHPRLARPRPRPELPELGATVTVTDPQAGGNARKTHPELGYADDPIAAVQDADLLLYLSEWAQFSHADPHRPAARATKAQVIDGRGTLNASTWCDAGRDLFPAILTPRGREGQ
ncbi:UDP binding domain-containing protein [Streptomyces mauvecolor]